MLNERGHEVPDPTPVARPVRWSPPETLVEQIRRFVRNEFSQQAAAGGFETFEEADDFDVDDDHPDPQSQWELTADQEDYRPEPSGEQGAEPLGLDRQASAEGKPAAAPKADAADSSVVGAPQGKP